MPPSGATLNKPIDYNDFLLTLLGSGGIYAKTCYLTTYGPNAGVLLSWMEQEDPAESIQGWTLCEPERLAAECGLQGKTLSTTVAKLLKENVLFVHSEDPRLMRVNADQLAQDFANGRRA